MLRSLKEFERYTVSAIDGDVGNVTNFLLDDQFWTIRYLIVETGGFFERHSVLISPVSFRRIDWSAQRFHLALTRDKVKNSPSVDVDQPVSRQHEREFFDYYGYPYFWGFQGALGMGGYPAFLETPRTEDVPVDANDNSCDIHLRSAGELRGYHVQGSDEAIGHVEDFIVDDESWRVRYLVIDTSNWWFGKKVLVAPHWAKRISWDERKVFVDMSRQKIKDSPEWSPTALINREFETRLHDYYDRKVYW